MSKQHNFEKLMISARYWLLGMAEHDAEYFKVIDAMEMGAAHHNGQRNGGEPEFIHQLQIFHYLRTMHKHIRNPATVYMLLFLHDALEDPNQKTKAYITPEQILEKFGAVFLVKLKKMSKEIMGETNPDYSLDDIFADEDTSVAKGGDRTNNVTSMIGVFKRARLERYVKETAEEFLPRLKSARRLFSDQEALFENMKLELVGTLTLIGHILEGYMPEDTPTAPAPTRPLVVDDAYKAIQNRVLRTIEIHLGLAPGMAQPVHNLVVDLGADSLDLVELHMAIEDEFGLEIRDEIAETVHTVQGIVDFVHNALKG